MTDSNIIELEVFEIKDKNPVLKYRLIIKNGILMSIWNKGLIGQRGKVFDNVEVKEYFHPLPIDPLELLNIDGQVNYKFEIKKLGWKDLYLNLSNNDQIKLELVKKPKSFWGKLIDFSLNGFWIWLERIGIVLTIMVSMLVILHQCYYENGKEKSNKSEEMQPNQIQSKMTSSDSLKNLKYDSL